MKKLLGMVALATALLVAGGARAATVDFVATQSAPGSGIWALTASNNTTIGVTAVQFLTGVNTTSMTPDSGIVGSLDAALTGLSGNPLTTGDADAQILSLTAAAAGTPPVGIIIIGAGAQNVALAQIVTSPGSLLGLLDCTDACGGNAFDVQGNAIPYTVTIKAPEPTSMLLIAVGLSGLALVRRRLV